MQVVPDFLVVAVQNRMELGAALDEAVELVMPAAKNEQAGISVTRLARGRYEARVNSEVPSGKVHVRGASDDAQVSNGASGRAPGSVWQGAGPSAQRVTCSLRTTAADMKPRRHGSKNWLTRCEVESFLSLASGLSVAVRDHETGELWRGSVDVTFPEHGFVWVLTDFGERKLLDIGVHTVWRADTPRLCACDAPLS